MAVIRGCHSPDRKAQALLSGVLQCCRCFFRCCFVVLSLLFCRAVVAVVVAVLQCCCCCFAVLSLLFCSAIAAVLQCCRCCFAVLPLLFCRAVVVLVVRQVTSTAGAVAPVT